MVNAMKNSLAKKQMASEWEPANHPLTSPEDSEAISAFDRAVVTMMQSQDMKAETVAHELGVSFQNLSEFRRGSRTIAAHRLYRMVRKDLEAAKVIISSLVDAAGFEPVQFRRKRRLTKIEAKQIAINWLRENSQAFDLLAEKMARDAGRTEEEFKSAWDETTDVCAFGGEH
jgi:transcriptional regulator with XRE-family HTH domain